MKRLEGKTALITGGGSGIGLATAKMFLEEGARVAITGRDAAKLQRAAAEMAGGDRLIHHSADVTDPAQVQGLVKAVRSQLGPIDILVNNAGLNVKERGFRDLTVERWQLLRGGNLDGAFYCIQAVLPEMEERKEGLIININSVAGLRAGPLGGAAYAAAKFGLRGLAICLGEEEKGHNIRVTSIYPGEVDTPILENRPQPITAEHRQRILQPEDVAAAVLFVATLPPRVNIPELIIKPASQSYV
jgi:NADP-dependent 3-hydroxy acid dehydrogenase YdfG